MKVRVHSDARAELRDARKWYYERSPLSATAFAQAIENAISRIAEAPSQYPLAEHRTRKLVLKRFPFNIFYLPANPK
ncbi:MAG TPA: type II toxin-antitoxin system RelE/ParE family toxin [Pyrinomonadaceae bacterium]|nr:type II toxin-antitoxin system RelE/ParE family toxin [Pyrinomonadaceae bacterium]